MPEPLVTRLGARLHLFVRPREREAFTSLFRDVLGLVVVELDFGLPEPILLVKLADGSFSAEFTDLAPPPPAPPIDDAAAFRGPWIEFRAPDVERTQQALRDAGVPEFRHPGSNHAYFVAPGGQVFRVLPLAYEGP